MLVPFELRPDMPEEGYPVSELQFAGHSNRVEEHLMRIAARDGFPMVIPAFIPKTHMALSLAEMGRDRGEVVHGSIHSAIFDAYFGKGRDIGTREVLLDIGLREGLDTAEIEDVWNKDHYGERLRQFRNIALHLGIDGTPAALICNELLIGARPYEILKEAVHRCLVTAENIEREAQVE